MKCPAFVLGEKAGQVIDSHEGTRDRIMLYEGWAVVWEKNNAVHKKLMHKVIHRACGVFNSRGDPSEAIQVFDARSRFSPDRTDKWGLCGESMIRQFDDFSIREIVVCLLFYVRRPRPPLCFLRRLEYLCLIT